MAEGAAGECTAHNSALAQAHTPCLDSLAQSGMAGLCQVIPKGFEASSELGNLALMGALMLPHTVSALEVKIKRGPLEALAAGIELGANDLAFRLSLLGVDAGGRVVDLSPGWLNNKNGMEFPVQSPGIEDCGVNAIRVLQRELAAELKAWGIELVADQGYRHLLIWRGAGEWFSSGATEHRPDSESPEGRFFPPSPIEALDKDVVELSALWGTPGIACSKGREVLRDFWRQASELLLPQRLLPWPWAGGALHSLELCPELQPLKRAVVAGVPMIRGLGLLLGYEAPLLPGASGLMGTDLAVKANAVVDFVRKGFECVYVHVEEPDLAGHARDIQAKAAAISRFDADLLAPLCEALPEAFFLVTCDHATSCSSGRHLNVELPFVLASPSEKCVQKNVRKISFGELWASVGGVSFATVQDIMGICVKR